MERIDPDRVELPAWYRPNPGRASDLAFILFTGEGERTRANRVTNGRWALSAFATASAAALSDDDTIYAVTPIYHPSGLLMSMGGAIAGGSRLALARDFDPTTFWAEVRRYGITVASYTWTMLREIADAPPDPGERHNPLRLFIGAGMPRGLWRRIDRRFAPARVLEFYAPTEGEAILVNLSGRKPGCKGKPLPGSAEVRLAAYDIGEGRLRERADGFAVECGPGEVGMLLTRKRGRRLDEREPAARAVRARRRLGGHRRPVPRRRRRRPVAGRPRLGADPHRARLRRLVPDHRRARRPRRRRLAAVYGVPTDDPDASLAVAAVTLLAGRDLDGGNSARRSPAWPRPNARTWCGSSTRSRSPPGTGPTRPRCGRPARPRPARASGAARATRTSACGTRALGAGRGYDRRRRFDLKGERTVLIADFGLGEALLTALSVFFLVIWIWILITILTDLFRDDEVSGVVKAVWVFFLVFLPFLTGLIYLIVRGGGMRERTLAAQREAKQEMDTYIRDTAGTSTADELAKLADLKAKGTISDEEFERMKAKLLA